MDSPKIHPLIIIVILKYKLSIDVPNQPQQINYEEHIENVFSKAVSKMKEWTLIRCTLYF